METYYESAADMLISHKRALQELASHGITAYESEGLGTSIEEFYTEMGKKDEYDAQAVLGYLGY